MKASPLVRPQGVTLNQATHKRPKFEFSTVQVLSYCIRIPLTSPPPPHQLTPSVVKKCSWCTLPPNLLRQYRLMYASGETYQKFARFFYLPEQYNIEALLSWVVLRSYKGFVLPTTQRPFPGTVHTEIHRYICTDQSISVSTPKKLITMAFPSHHKCVSVSTIVLDGIRVH